MNQQTATPPRPVLDRIVEGEMRAAYVPLTEIDAAAKAHNEVESLERENYQLEDRIKSEAHTAFCSVQDGLSELYTGLKILPKESRTYEADGVSVKLDARGLHVRIHDKDCGLRIDYAPKKLERMLSGTRQQWSVAIQNRERRSNGAVWADQDKADQIDPLRYDKIFSWGSAVAFSGSFAAYYLNQAMSTGSQPQALISSICLGIAAAASIPLYKSVKEERVSRKMEKEAKQKGRQISTTNSTALANPETTLSLLCLASETLNHVQEKIGDHLHNEKAREPLYGKRNEELRQRKEQLERLLKEKESYDRLGTLPVAAANVEESAPTAHTRNHESIHDIFRKIDHKIAQLADMKELDTRINEAVEQSIYLTTTSSMTAPFSTQPSQEELAQVKRHRDLMNGNGREGPSQDIINKVSYAGNAMYAAYKDMEQQKRPELNFFEKTLYGLGYPEMATARKHRLMRQSLERER